MKAYCIRCGYFKLVDIQACHWRCENCGYNMDCSDGGFAEMQNDIHHDIG